MLLSAQRVMSDVDEGINASRYVHLNPGAWPENPLDALEYPRQRVWHVWELSPGGNRVLSYLDVALPTDATTGELETAVEWFFINYPLSGGSQFRHGRIGFQFDLVEALEDEWREEFSELLAATLED